MPRKRLSERQLFERSISEEDVFGACRALLELNGARVHRIVERIPWGPRGRKSEAGIPDVFGWFPAGRLLPLTTGSSVVLQNPRHFFIEMKKPHGAVYRPAQYEWVRSAGEDGVIVFFADSVDAMVRGFAEFGIVIKGVQPNARTTVGGVNPVGVGRDPVGPVGVSGNRPDDQADR